MIEYSLKEIEILKRKDGSCFLMGGISLNQPGKRLVSFKFDKTYGLRLCRRTSPEVVSDLREKLEALTA